MIMFDDGHTNIRCIVGDGGLADFSVYYDLEREHFDCVITNPPYGGDPVKDSAVLGRFALGRKEDGVGILKSQEKEILFLERCFEFLKPGGRLVILLHDGVLANTRAERIRRWYREHGKLKAIISLPNVTFTPYGAKGIETSVLVFRKWHDGEVPTEDYDVIVGHIEDVGYTADGRECRCAKCAAYRADSQANKDGAERARDEVDDFIHEFHQRTTWDD
jgi:type I restriction enzyme M protein